MFQGPSLNAKPAPIHAGDFDAAGYSTVLQTSSGWAGLQSGPAGSGQEAAAARTQYAPRIPETGLRSPIVAIGLLIAGLIYLDRRIAK